MINILFYLKPRNFTLGTLQNVIFFSTTTGGGGGGGICLYFGSAPITVF